MAATKSTAYSGQRVVIGRFALSIRAGRLTAETIDGSEVWLDRRGNSIYVISGPACGSVLTVSWSPERPTDSSDAP